MSATVDHQIVIDAGGGDADFALADQLRRPVLDGVLDDRLQREGGQTDLGEFGRDVDDHVEIAGETRLFDLEIGLNVVDLVFERHLLGRALEILAEEHREVLNQLARPRSGSFGTTAANVFKVLKRKCGLTCACSSFSSDWVRSCFCAS